MARDLSAWRIASGWTPGPWAHGDEGLNPHLVIAPASGRIVARVDNEGNRHLIVAAPELYAILWDLLGVWDPQWEPGVSLRARAVDVCAKARGER
jgi:hypothetical protein